jgi:hypothetical protein
MQKLKIEIVNEKPKIIDNELGCKSQITIGDFKESFIMPLDSWTSKEYKRQWQEGLERIKQEDTSCLITAVRTLEKRPRIELWILYKVGGMIFIQNHLLGGKIFKERAVNLPAFDTKTCYLYIPPRETLTDEGEKLSEWSLSVDEI